MSIYTGIPVGHAVNSIVDANTVMNMPNAQVIGNENVQMYYLDGTPVSGGYASPGNDVKVLEIFEGMVLALIPIGNGPEGDGQWVIGFFEPSTLGNTIKINYNTIVWNNAENKTVVDSNGNFLYSLPANQLIQFLYETPNNNYACILFNNESGALATGYVPMSEGAFYRYSYKRTGPLQEPGIADNSLPSGINMNLQTGFSTLNGPANIISSFNNINSGEKVPSYFELSNGLNGCTVLNSSGELENNNYLTTFNAILSNNNNYLSPAYYHHLYDPNYIQGALSCREQGIIFGNALVNNYIPSTYYVLGLKIDESSFNNSTSVSMNEIEQCASEFMQGLESTISGNFQVMLYTTLNMINNVSTPPLYESSLTNALLWMDSYLPGITNSTYEPTNPQIINAFYEMNSASWGGQTGWSIWGYENSNDITSCIINLDVISAPTMYYNPITSNNQPTNQPTNNLEVGDVVQIKSSAEYFAVGPSIGSLNNDLFQITELIDINTGASNQNGYLIIDCSTEEKFNVYANEVEKTND